MSPRSVCGDRQKYQRWWWHPPSGPCVTTAWPELTRKSQCRAWCFHRLFATNKDAETPLTTSILGKARSLSSFSNSKSNSEQEKDCSPYLLIDIVIPAEVSGPPWKDMHMNMLKMWNKIMVIIKLMSFFSGLSALFSTHISNRARASTALFSEENTSTCSITVSQLFGEYKRWKTWERSSAALYELQSEMPGSLGALWNYS